MMSILIFKQKQLIILIIIEFFCITNVFGGGFEIGAGLHLGQGRQTSNISLASLRILGFTSFRDEAYWSDFENPSGIFLTDRLPLELRKALLDSRYATNTMLVLGYGNVRYDNGGRPFSDTGREAFTRYALEVGKAYPKLKYLEIWNEWNHTIGVPDGSVGTAESYFKLVSAVSPALRASGIRSTIVVGSLADDLPNWPTAQKLVRMGILNYGDAFSVHLYNYSAGANAVPQEMLNRLIDLQAVLRSGNGGKDFPIFVTEIGWPTHSGRAGSTESEAGSFLAQFLFEATAYKWIKGVWIYELFDGGPSRVEREHNFGLLKVDGSAKQGACIVRSAIELLRESDFVGSGNTKGGVRWIRYSGKIDFLLLYSPGRLISREVYIRSGMTQNASGLCQVTTNAASGLPAGDWAKRFIGSEPLIIFLDNNGVTVSDVIR